MSRSVTWLLTKAGMRVRCELTDAEYQGLPQATLVGLLAGGVVVTRTVKVPIDEFMAIGGLEKGLGKP
jgi:hypothetical protein